MKSKFTTVLVCGLAIALGLLIGQGLMTEIEANQAAAPEPVQPCFSIFENGSADYLLNQCTGQSWRFDSGYNWSTETQDNPPAWVAIPSR